MPSQQPSSHPTKLAASESLAILHEPLTNPRSSDASFVSRSSQYGTTPTVVRVAVRHERLVLLSVAVVAFVVALTLTFSSRGVVIETFERREVQIADQEKLLEKYNSYSGTVTALLERPVELFVVLVTPVVALRVRAHDGGAFSTGTRWRLALAAAGAGGSFLLANALSAVNVQVRELPVQSVILAGELDAPAAGSGTEVSSVDRSFPEARAGNPSANTILRNLVLPRPIEPRGTCPDSDLIDTLDRVDYGIPQLPWMTHLLATALVPNKTMTLAIAATNTAANAALTPDQLPMDASLAADLVVISYLKGGTWGGSARLYDDARDTTFFREDNKSNYGLFGPTARLTKLLPAAPDSSELEDRAWFLKHAAPTLFNISDPSYRDASLLSWTMELARVDIVPGAVWVDSVTVEREMATPQMVTNTSVDGRDRYFAYTEASYAKSPNHLSFAPFGGFDNEGIDMYRVCTDPDGFETLTSSKNGAMNPEVVCSRQSNRSLMLLSRGRRLVADARVENATLNSSRIVRGREAESVVVNLRMVVTTTVARITWEAQNLSEIFSAQCDASDSCRGFALPLPGSGQRLLVNASTLPVALAPPLVDTVTNRGVKPLVLVSVRRPQTFTPFRRPSEPAVIGDVLLPHNIGNLTWRASPASDCDSTVRSRMVAYTNNHVYMETTLQATYTAAAFFLFQRGVTRDVVNQSATAKTVLAFHGNRQDVDVYVYIPWLNVVLTLAGCALLATAVAVAVLWPRLRPHQVDPLARITGPHAIASVLLNESAFPPLLLTRSVADAGDETPGSRDDAGEFVIQSISLQRAALGEKAV